MKTTVVGVAGLILAGAVFSTAFAEERGTPDASEPVQTLAPGKEMSAAELRAHRGSKFCVAETGTRIRARAGREGCRFVGRSYGADDLRRTGESDVGRALQRLDPSIQGRRW